MLAKTIGLSRLKPNWGLNNDVEPPQHELTVGHGIDDCGCVGVCVSVCWCVRERMLVCAYLRERVCEMCKVCQHRCVYMCVCTGQKVK